MRAAERRPPTADHWSRVMSELNAAVERGDVTPTPGECRAIRVLSGRYGVEPPKFARRRRKR